MTEGLKKNETLFLYVCAPSIVSPVRHQDSSVFIVAKMDDIPLTVQWNAMLSGGMVCIPAHVEFGRGPAHTFQCSMSSKRIVWMTARFIQKWPAIAKATAHRTHFPSLHTYCHLSVCICNIFQIPKYVICIYIYYLQSNICI